MHQLVRSKHLSMLHAGMTLLLATLDRTLHIIGARRLVRTITRSCITCRKVSARTEQHIMGQLPQRVSPSPPFTTQASNLLTHLPSSKPVLIKAYVCLFICFSTKAVHLEVVSDLITAAFTTSLHHFISWCGLPTEIHSDNGTNFVGAANDLKDLYHFFSNDSTQKMLSTALSNRCITWLFNPERVPHFGGIWEAADKSAKIHLRRVIGLLRFTIEELSTILCHLEACLNCHPLLPVNAPSDDAIEILTPGHSWLDALSSLFQQKT